MYEADTIVTKICYLPLLLHKIKKSEDFLILLHKIKKVNRSIIWVSDNARDPMWSSNSHSLFFLPYQADSNLQLYLKLAFTYFKRAFQLFMPIDYSNTRFRSRGTETLWMIFYPGHDKLLS